MRFLLVLATLLAPYAASAALLADVSDMKTYAPRAAKGMKEIEAARHDHRFTDGGATFVSGLHLLADGQRDSNGTHYRAAALMRRYDGRLMYRKFQITVGNLVPVVTGINVEADIDLSATNFSIRVGLIDRLVVVEDAANGIRMAFPLGVGGIDEAVMGPAYRSVTPRFSGARLERRNVQAERTTPSYYRGRPFMPITTARGTVTAIAFHISILGDSEAQQYGLNYLVRGFESHGCMRMRDKDLKELFAIVMEGGSEALPVTVANHVNADEQHPYPTNDRSFMRVTYFPEAPHFRRDDIPGEHLVIMDRAGGQPDYRRLEQLLQPASEMLNGLDEEEAPAAGVNLP